MLAEETEFPKLTHRDCIWIVAMMLGLPCIGLAFALLFISFCSQVMP